MQHANLIFLTQISLNRQTYAAVIVYTILSYSREASLKGILNTFKIFLNVHQLKLFGKELEYKESLAETDVEKSG